MAEEQDSYKKMLTDIVQKHMVILGPNIAIEKARKVPGLVVADDGQIQSIQGDSQLILRSLANEYSSLAGQVAGDVVANILKKYPEIKPF